LLRIANFRVADLILMIEALQMTPALTKLAM
jgi:hypothetical protein